MKIIKCDKCGKTANEGRFSNQPPTVTIDRGSNLLIGGGYNRKSWELCESCFENILVIIEQALKGQRQ